MLHPIPRSCCFSDAILLPSQLIALIMWVREDAGAQRCDLLQFLQVQGQMWAPALCTGIFFTIINIAPAVMLPQCIAITCSTPLHSTPLYCLVLHHAYCTIVSQCLRCFLLHSTLGGGHHDCHPNHTALSSSLSLREPGSAGLLVPL